MPDFMRGDFVTANPGRGASLRILALGGAGAGGLAGMVILLVRYGFPTVGVWTIAGCVVLAFFVVLLTLIAGSTLRETAILVVMVAAIDLGLIFAGGDRIGEFAKLLLWTVLIAVLYIPVVFLAMACLARRKTGSRRE